MFYGDTAETNHENTAFLCLVLLQYSLCGCPVKSVNLTIVLENFKHLLSYKLESWHDFVPLSAISWPFSCENVQPLLMTA